MSSSEDTPVPTPGPARHRKNPAVRKFLLLKMRALYFLLLEMAKAFFRY
jgi:hypothetical protein